MKMVLTGRFLVLLIVGLFLAVSVVPGSSFSINPIDTEPELNQFEDISFNSTFPYPVADIDINERWSEREDFERDLYERYPWHYGQHPMNHSGYLCEEPYSLYPGYDTYSNTFQHGLFDDEYIRNHTLKNRNPTSKPNFAAGKTWYVDDDGGKDFTKIQDAINAANNGDTVFVYSGIYYENVVVDKSIILRGEDRNTTIIDGGGSGDVVHISADCASIYKFYIHNSGDFSNDAGIKVSSNYNYLSGNKISNNSGGIRIDISNNNVISGNNIQNNLVGIYLSSSTNNIIYNNTCSNRGMWIFSSNSNTITNNIFIKCGLIVFDSYQNTVYNNKVNGKSLVYLEEESDIIIDDAGQIILMDCDRITIQNQNISDTDSGIQLLNTNNCILSDNKISNCLWFGITLQDSVNNIISDNSLSDVACSITLDASSSNTINGNTLSNNYRGIFLHYSSNNIIIGNNIDSNNFSLRNDVGIGLYESCNNIISENDISNYIDGIYLIWYSHNNIVIGNIISSNNYSGIYLQDSHNNIINYNIIQFNDGSGIEFNYAGNNNLSSNNFISNKPGINLRGSSNIIKNNAFFNDGILVTSSGSIISGNTVNGKPLVYLKGETEKVIGEAGQIILIDCEHITVKNQDLSNTYIGIILGNTNNCIIVNNTITLNQGDGILLSQSFHNTINRNNISHNWESAVYFLGSCYSNNITNNIINSNQNEGINIYGDNNIVSTNTISSNRGYGIRLVGDNTTIIGNSISNNSNGIYLKYWSNNNKIKDNFCSSNFQNGIVIKESFNNEVSNCLIQDHKWGSGILLEGSNSTLIQDCCILNNMRGGIKLDTFSTGTNITSCLLTHNSWGIDLTISEFNRIERCTIANNIYGGILEGQNNTVCNNNFIDNYNHYFHKNWYDTNKFHRNYWSGRLIQSPLPYRIFNLNFDWFPKAVPYNYPTYSDILADESDGRAFDSIKSMIWNENYNDQNNHFTLKDKVSERASSIFSKVYDVLNQDHCHLLNRWRDDR